VDDFNSNASALLGPEPPEKKLKVVLLEDDEYRKDAFSFDFYANNYNKSICLGRSLQLKYNYALDMVSETVGVSEGELRLSAEAAVQNALQEGYGGALLVYPDHSLRLFSPE
jgi:hypothetical protein